MLKGIVIVAIGHPEYGRNAFNLAVTIKAVELFPVALIYDDTAISHLDSQQISLFDHLIHAPHLKPNCSAKLSTYDLSPFDATLVLDADMLWLPRRKPSELFAELEGATFTAISEGDTDNPSAEYFFWAHVDEIREKYNVTKIHQWRTEVMYFEKGEKAAALFNHALAINKDHGLSYVKDFAGGLPDELSINIAAAIMGIEPHIANWQPSYWPHMNGHKVPEFDFLYRNYYVFSVGGNHQTENIKVFYNRIMKAQAPKIGLQHSFPLQSKHTYLPERRKS